NVGHQVVVAGGGVVVPQLGVVAVDVAAVVLHTSSSSVSALLDAGQHPLEPIAQRLGQVREVVDGGGVDAPLPSAQGLPAHTGLGRHVLLLLVVEQPQHAEGGHGVAGTGDAPGTAPDLLCHVLDI